MAVFTAIGAAIGAIGSAIGAVSGFIGGLGVVGSTLLNAAVGIGLNLLAQAIAGKPKDPTFSVNGTLRAGGDVPRSFIMGRTVTAGSLVWANTWGKSGETDNAYMTQVIALSDLPITGIDSIEVNGENCPLDVAELVQSSGDGNAIGTTALGDLITEMGLPDNFLFRKWVPGVQMGDRIAAVRERLAEIITSYGGTPIFNSEQSEMGFPIPAYKKDGKNNLWLKFYDGTQTEADDFLSDRASNGQRQWDSNRIGKGVAYAIVTAKVSGNMFSGIPSFKFVVNGIPLYDITKDATAGGSGAHLWSDPSTWGGDGDHLPAVQAYNLLRGIQWDGEWFYGVQGLAGAPARLPAANWIAAIGKCRATVEGEDGPEPSYRSAGEITVDAPLANALEAINTTCQGRISEVGGIYSMYLGAPDEPSFSFTDGDILSTEEQNFTPFFGLADTINGVFANYPSPDDGWGLKSAPPLYRTDLEARHGNRRLMADIELTFVPYPEQVQRLMKQALLEGQRARRHTIVLPPEFWPYAVPGAICAWTSDRNGYVAKLFRIDGVADRANLDVMIDITEVDPADYVWDTGADYTPPVDGTVGPLRPQPQPIVDFFAEPDTVVGSGDKVRPAIRLEWDGEKADIAGVEFQVRLADTLEVVHQSRTDDYAAGAIRISNNLFSNTAYGVRARYIPASERDTLWSDWLAVTTPNIPNTDVLAKLGNLGNDVKAQLTQLRLDAANVRSMLETLAAAALDMATQASQGQSVAVKRGDALAAAMSSLSAEVTEDLAAFAEALTAVLAQVGPTGAEGLFRISAEATPGDAQARIGLSVSATANGVTKLASIFLDALASGDSRVVLLGDQVAIADSLGNVSALFDSTGVYIENAFIHNLTGVNIMAESIDSPSLAFQAVTEYEDIAYSDNVVGTFNEGDWTHHLTVIVDIPSGNPCIEFINLSAQVSKSNLGVATGRIRVKRNGNASSVASGELAGEAIRSTSGDGNGTTTTTLTTFHPAGTTTLRYDVWTFNVATAGADSTAVINVDCESGVLFWKR